MKIQMMGKIIPKAQADKNYCYFDIMRTKRKRTAKSLALSLPAQLTLSGERTCPPQRPPPVHPVDPCLSVMRRCAVWIYPLTPQIAVSNRPLKNGKMQGSG
jgi:hypothetical protein